jgi:ubiquitin-conjugating enzyme E2 Q
MTSYPDESTFLIFTSNECQDFDVFPILKRVAFATKGSTIQDVIQAVSTQLTAKLAGVDTPDAEHEAFCKEEVHDNEYNGTPEPSNGTCFDSSIESQASGPCEKPLDHIHGQEDRTRLYKDLKAAQRAGIAVGIYPAHNSVEAISLSVRASKLAISPEAMGAWGIEAKDHVVLLVRPSRRYLGLEALFESSKINHLVRFRFGKCAIAKPSLKSVRLAFNYGSDYDKESEDAENAGLATFSQVYMSRPIDVLFENSFFKMLKLRIRHGYSWDRAQTYLNMLAGQTQSEITTEDLDSSEPTSDHEGSVSEHVGWNLQDYDALAGDDSHSLLLMAMQFALRRFSRCTEYCMVCHVKLQNDFETLKPYICSKALCMYQYLSLGLGVNIEQEVINNPFVVDLLISLFYAAESQGGIREFPRGLALRAPVIQTSEAHLKIETNIQSQRFWIPPSSYGPAYVGMQNKIRGGVWFAMFIERRRRK